MPWPKHTPSNLRRKSEDGTVQARVYCAIPRGERMTRAELAKELKLPMSVVLAALWTLRQQNRIRLVGAGRASVYERVPGSTVPPDMRGRRPTSLRNLLPGQPDKLQSQHQEWRKRGAPGLARRKAGAARPAWQDLEMLWR